MRCEFKKLTKYFFFFRQEEIARLQQENREQEMKVRHTAVI